MTSQDSKTPRRREVTGTILRSEVVFDSEYYRPVVKYKYEVDGVSYEGDTIVAGLVQFNWRGPADRLVERYPIGARVPVFVDPAYPRRAALQPGVDRKLPLLVSIIVGFLVLLLVLFVRGRP